MFEVHIHDLKAYSGYQAVIARGLSESLMTGAQKEPKIPTCPPFQFHASMTMRALLPQPFQQPSPSSTSSLGSFTWLSLCTRIPKEMKNGFWSIFASILRFGLLENCKHHGLNMTFSFNGRIYSQKSKPSATTVWR